MLSGLLTDIGIINRNIAIRFKIGKRKFKLRPSSPMWWLYILFIGTIKAISFWSVVILSIALWLV